jgi:hypothetical protein
VRENIQEGIDHPVHGVQDDTEEHEDKELKTESHGYQKLNGSKNTTKGRRCASTNK